MDRAMLNDALEIALGDEAFSAAFDGASALSISEGEDGSITLDAGGESVVVSAEDLMGESDGGSMPPPPPAVGA